MKRNIRTSTASVPFTSNPIQSATRKRHSTRIDSDCAQNNSEQKEDSVSKKTKIRETCIPHWLHNTFARSITSMENESKQHPYDASNWFMKISISFALRFMLKGYAHPWNIDDMSDPPNYIRITRNYNATKNNNVWKLLFTLNKELWFISAVCYNVWIILSMLSVFIVARVIDIVMHPSNSNSITVSTYCVSFVLIELLRHILGQNFWMYATLSALKTKNMIMTLLLNKIMKVSLDESMGKILNGISTDCDRLYQFIRYSVCWSMSIFLILASLPIYIYIIGYEAIFGYVILLTIVPLFSAYTANKQKQYMQQGLLHSDKRLKLFNEMLMGIRMVKMYGWEIPLIQQMNVHRSNEVKYYKYTIFMKTLAFVFNNITEALIVSVMIMARIFILHKDIDFVSLYTMYLFIKVLRYPIGNFLEHFEKVIDGYVAVQRIQRIFHFERNTDAHDMMVQKDNDNGNLIEIQHINFQHYLNRTDNMLCDVNLRIKRSQLTAVIGNFASGKSTLLSSILGEKYMHRIKDNTNTSFMKVFSKNIIYGYVGHDYFIINASVRENIIMNERYMYNAKIYNLALDSCALKHDMSIFPAADSTEIGEKGINISGGQKARICVARIIYRYLIHRQSQKNADIDYIILLDDPLSAVDNDVAHHIFNNAILKLCAKATVIMSLTSHLKLLDKFDRVIVMKTYDNKCLIDHDCIVNTQNLKVLNAKYTALLRRRETKGDIIEDIGFEMEQKHHYADVRCIANDEESDEDENVALLKKKKSEQVDVTVVSDVGRLITKEDRVKGAVNRSSLKKFISDGYGVTVFLLMILQYTVFEAVFIAFEYFVNMWASSKIHVSYNDVWYIFIGFILCMILSDLWRSSLLFLCIAKSSIRYSNKCLHKVCFAKIEYFDQNPNGRIVNRFSNDLKIIDLNLPVNCIRFARHWTQFLTCTVVIVINIPYMLLPVIISMLFFYYIAIIYLHNSRELRRLDLITNSTIFSIFSQVCGGLVTVRALNLENYFVHKVMKQLELNSTIVFNQAVAICWFYINTGVLLTLQTLSVCIVSIVLTNNGYLSPSIAVLCIVLQASFSSFLQKIILYACSTEIDLTAIERLYHFYNIENEFDDYYYHKERHITTKLEHGNIRFNNLTFKYRSNLPNILQNVSFSISAGECIGFCGRTGSGKSTVFVCLMRLFEVEDNAIYIDGIDINKIALYDLRSNVSIIPQTPLIFIGTIRFNLDPFDRYDDAELIRALQLCYLYPKYDLSFVTESNGGNLSQGEKQLLCIARCIVRNTKILLLDESTSNIDHEYDELIQNVISNNFRDCTILTIAHRLNTIINNDKILVLDDGKIQQFDTPSNLLKDTNGVFYKLNESYSSVSYKT